MDIFTATMLAEGDYSAAGYDDTDRLPDEETLIEAWQLLIDTEVAWQLQGCIGRTAARLIQNGICHAKGD